MSLFLHIDAPEHLKSFQLPSQCEMPFHENLAVKKPINMAHLHWTVSNVFRLHSFASVYYELTYVKVPFTRLYYCMYVSEGSTLIFGFSDASLW